MIFKSGVSIEGIKPDAWAIAVYADEVWKELERPEGVTITSGTDGRHMPGSKHYVGLAFDLRTHYFTPFQKGQAVQALRDRLGKHYDVVPERTHIHVEYDYKRM